MEVPACVAEDEGVLTLGVRHGEGVCRGDGVHALPRLRHGCMQREGGRNQTTAGYASTGTPHRHRCSCCLGRCCPSPAGRDWRRSRAGRCLQAIAAAFEQKELVVRRAEREATDGSQKGRPSSLPQPPGLLSPPPLPHPTTRHCQRRKAPGCRRSPRQSPSCQSR